MIRIMLSLEDFRNLVQGKVVEKAPPGPETVEIALSDIGFTTMAEEVLHAAAEGGRLPKDKAYPADAGQCHGCGGNGCATCDDKGWLPAGHPEIRRCEAGCGVAIPPDQIAVYCSTACALNDA